MHEDFELRIIDLYWITNQADDPTDLCLHGKIFVRIGNEIVDDGKTKDNSWTVSTGAYRMLKSLYFNHSPSSGEHLLPCCGFSLFIDENNTSELIISDCPFGLDWAVAHENNKVTLISAANTQVVIPLEDYKKIVFDFADEIKAFYDKSSEKRPETSHEKSAYKLFWKNWEKLRNGTIK